MPTEGQSPLVQKKAESVHVETDRNPLVFPFKTTQSLPFALRPADEPHFFCLTRYHSRSIMVLFKADGTFLTI